MHIYDNKIEVECDCLVRDVSCWEWQLHNLCSKLKSTFKFLAVSTEYEWNIFVQCFIITQPIISWHKVKLDKETEL